MRMRLTLLLAAVLLLASCDDNPFKPSDVKEVTWKLESIERTGTPVLPVPNPENYTMKLGNDARVSVRADCNQCSSTYTLDGAVLKIELFACTLIACGIGSLDSTYISMLQGTSAITLDGSHLILRSTSGTLRFRS